MAVDPSGKNQKSEYFPRSNTPVERDRMSAAPVRVSPHGAAHVRPGYVRHGKTLPERTTRPPAGALDAIDAFAGHIGAEPATADQQQAEYFLRLLGQRARYIDHRIDDIQKAIAASEAGGDTENTRDIRRQSRTEEKDRETVDGLIENLQRRFAVRSGEVSHNARPARPVVR
jgi:hypothetical protein